MVLVANVSLPSDGIKLQVPQTRAFISNEDFGEGVLCVAESNLIWKQDNGSGLCFEYPHIALHAVSSDLNAFPHECLYVMLDKNIMKQEDSVEENEAGYAQEQEEDEENITEIRFVPSDKALLNPLFQAMNHCQALYPDEMSPDEDEGDDDEEGEEDEEYEEGEENGNGNGNGHHEGAEDDDENFADAD